MRQHDAAGADANAGGGSAQRRQQDFRCAAGHRGEGVMLRYPEPCIAELLAPLRHLQGFLQGDGSLVRGAGQ